MIYFALLDSGAIKIGCSDNVRKRREALISTYGSKVEILATMEGNRETEKELHERFSHLRFGATEQFRPAADLLAFIGKPFLVSMDPDLVEVQPNLGEAQFPKSERVSLRLTVETVRQAEELPRLGCFLGYL